LKRIMKRTLGHFKDLLEHSLRPYEPSPEHILERIVKPICQDARTIRKKGTRNGSWNLIQGLAEECETIFNQSTPGGEGYILILGIFPRPEKRRGEKLWGYLPTRAIMPPMTMMIPAAAYQWHQAKNVKRITPRP